MTIIQPPERSVSLPPLNQVVSPNQSTRRGTVPFLIVVHRPAGGYQSAIRTLCDPASEASAHIVTDSGREATQLVPWDRKAWSCRTFNSVSYNVEVDDDAWTGDTAGFNAAARIVAFLCTRTGIPPRWSTSPTHKPGVIRHYDLGKAGGGHTDPTLDVRVWQRFIERVTFEHKHGVFRPAYGAGELHRIDL